MNSNPLKQGILTENSVGIGTVTREMVGERAIELAIIDGRTSQKISKSDWESAKRELTGKPEIDPQESILESAPESERWDPFFASLGTQAPKSPSEDEDEEGLSDSARLVAEGVSEANHDQMLQAGKKRLQS